MSGELFEQFRQPIRAYVMQLFAELHSPVLCYHNLEHTLQVVTRALAIAEYYQLDDKELFILFSAAWFHDTGQLFGPSAGHEAVSVGIMKKFFASRPSIPADLIYVIEQGIMVTKLPSCPTSLLQEIMCDADTYHLGTPDFWQTDELMRQETILRGGNDDNWRERTYLLLLNHKYYTSYCCEKLEAGKANNLAMLA